MYLVRVYFRNKKNYGGGVAAKTLEEAREAARIWLMLGYGADESEIRILVLPDEKLVEQFTAESVRATTQIRRL